MITTRESKPQSPSTEFGIALLSRPTTRLTTYMETSIDTPLTDDYAKEICDRLNCTSSRNLRHRVNIYGWTETTLVSAHALALQYLENQSLEEGQIRPGLAVIFLILHELHRRSRRLTTPVVRLINPGDRQTLTIFHRPGLPHQGKHSDVVQVFHEQSWCGQIKQLNPLSSVSTAFCQTSRCPTWAEEILLQFANHPSFIENKLKTL